MDSDEHIITKLLKDKDRDHEKSERDDASHVETSNKVNVRFLPRKRGGQKGVR